MTRRRWIVLGVLATVLLALTSAGAAYRLATREVRALPATALAPPARF